MATGRGGSVIGGSALWYLTRGTGVVSLLLLTGVVVLGISGRVGWADRRWPRFLTQGLHRNLSLMAVAFIGVHVATSIVDGYAPIRWIDALVPFGSAYRPVWLGLGAVAFDLVLALVITSLMRVRLGLRAWRGVHWLAYACWPVALVHGLGTGSDTRSIWMLGLVAGCVATVGWALAWRERATAAAPGVRATVGAVGSLGIAGIAIFLVAGPLQTGWATTAGTPRGLLNARTAVVSYRLPATASFAGSLSQQQQAGGDVVLQMVGDLNPTRFRLAIDLSGTPSGAGFAVTNGTVALGPTTQPSRFTGAVTSIDQGQIRALLTGPGGRVDLVADLTIHGSAVSGSVEMAQVA
jgi:sulfoxide reductase heme-binding subunit YedZ